MVKCLVISIVCSVMLGLTNTAQSAHSGPLLVLPDAKAHHLVLINPRTNTVEDTIAVPGWPHEVTFPSDGRTAYVPSYSDTIVGKPGFDGQSIDIVDMETRKATRTLDLERPLRPHMPMISKDGKLLITAELAQSILIMNPKDGKIDGAIPTGAKESHVFVMSANGKKIYTANLHAGSVSVLDVAERKLVKVIPVSELVNRIALSRDGNWLFVTDGQQQRVVLIDTKTDKVTKSVAVGEMPFSLYPSPDGKWLFVGEDDGRQGQLEAIDLGDLTPKHRFPADRLPYGIRMIGDRAFVACYLNANLDILNTATWAMEPPIANVAHGDGIAVWNGVQ